MIDNEKRLKEKYGIITTKKKNFKKIIPGYKKNIQNVQNDDDDDQESQIKKGLSDQAGFFTGHVLNRDRELAKYMPYNEVFYPTLFEDEKLPPEFIENGLWMSGFLDRAARDNDLNEKLKKKRLKGKDKGVTGSGVSSADGKIRDNLSSKNLSKDIPQNPTTEYHSNHHSSSIAVSSIEKYDNNHKDINNDERDAIAKKISQQKLLSNMIKPYIKSLTKEKSKSLTDSNKKKKQSDRNNMISYELENIFEIQRIENKAAEIIQAVYRRMRILYHWRQIVACVTKVPTIQRFVRGMITRKFVALWFKSRTRVTIIWQVVRIPLMEGI
jgi:hypothetical protein